MQSEKRWVFAGWYQGRARYMFVEGIRHGPKLEAFRLFTEGNSVIDFQMSETFDSIGKAHGAQKSRTLAEIKKLETEIKTLNKIYERLITNEPVDITKTESK